MSIYNLASCLESEQSILLILTNQKEVVMQSVNKISLVVSWVVFVLCLIGMSILFATTYKGWMLLVMILVAGIFISELMGIMSFFITRWIMMGIGMELVMQKMEQAHAFRN